MSYSIVTHHGQAHRDEFISCCIWLAHDLPVEVIHRREPTAEELADPSCLVIDVGRRHEPELRNFDHHQLERDAAPCCALTLTLQHLQLYRAARLASPWLRFTEVLDSKGPVQARSLVGIPEGDGFAMTLSPVEAQLLIMFGNARTIYRDEPLWNLMRTMGLQWTSYWQKFEQRFRKLQTGCLSEIIATSPFAMIFDIDVASEPHLALEQYCQFVESQEGHPPIDITVTRDDRGDGWCLYRRNDAKHVDFSVIADDPLVTFAHNNGFVAKTKPCDLDDLKRLIRLAVV